MESLSATPMQTIEQALKAGNATEHTHRPALKALLETLDLILTDYLEFR